MATARQRRLVETRYFPEPSLDEPHPYDETEGCPYCGGDVELEVDDWDPENGASYVAICSNPQCKGY